MSDITTRDKIWAQALCALMANDQLQRGDLDDSETNTSQRVLRSMEAMGLVERSPDDPRTWYRGEAWFWMTRATPQHEVVWDPDAERLVLVDIEEAA